MNTKSKLNVYGYCPICGAEGVERERRINGNDKCRNWHIYSSSSALKSSAKPSRQGIDPDKLKKYLSRYSYDCLVETNDLYDAIDSGSLDYGDDNERD